MSTLMPHQAALIAGGVYSLRERTVSQSADRGVKLGCEDMFAVDGSSRFTGRSGGLISVKQLSGFGYIAAGTGSYQNEVLVATRGTETMYDWLSNFNIGMQLGPGGQLVHAGFHEVWKSFSVDVANFLRGRNPTVIHCVGHSLGGALATLNADYFSSIGAAEVKLYTFGSPRAGGTFFARSLTRRVGRQNMYRVHHRSDPVPKIPLFPFIHVPTAEPGYQLTAGPSGLINTDAHSMELSYVPGVGRDSWQALARRGVSGEDDMNAQLWLDQVSAGGGGILMGGAWGLMMIGKALNWLMGKIGTLALNALGLQFTMGMTVLDQLAWLLSKGAELSIEVSSYVGAIITAIFRFLGRTATAGASLTVSFIRWVLGLLFKALVTVANREFMLVS
jgi:triacylglycerol lipase